jgi:hypothetical protein
MEDGMSETTASNAPAPAPAVEVPAPVNVSDFGEDRNPVFEMLVAGDTDIIGLVAYSIYKQNKRDWLIAFATARGREPTEDERISYIIGDSTPRRLATFRHLAQATLEGRGPDVPFEPGQKLGPDGVLRHYPIAQRPRLSAFARDIAGNNTRSSFIALGVVALVAIYLAARFGLPGVTH